VDHLFPGTFGYACIEDHLASTGHVLRDFECLDSRGLVSAFQVERAGRIDGNVYLLPRTSLQAWLRLAPAFLAVPRLGSACGSDSLPGSGGSPHRPSSWRHGYAWW
jgi:hypothetical protein